MRGRSRPMARPMAVMPPRERRAHLQLACVGEIDTDKDRYLRVTPIHQNSGLLSSYRFPAPRTQQPWAATASRRCEEIANEQVHRERRAIPGIHSHDPALGLMFDALLPSSLLCNTLDRTCNRNGPVHRMVPPTLVGWFGLSLGGCAGPAAGLAAAYNRDATISVVYQVPGGIEPVAGAPAARVLVSARDRRTTDRDRIGIRRDVFGTPMGIVRASYDVPEITRVAVEQNLKAQGFRIGPGGAIAQVEVLRCSADFPIRGFGWSVAATVELRMSVQNTVNTTVTKTYTGAASESDSSQADFAMSEALASSVSRMVSDKDLQTVRCTAQNP